MALYLTQGLHRSLQRQPDHPATIFAGRTHTYQQYGERIARLAAALCGLGMAAGDRVGMLALNSDRYLEYFHGTWWGGGAVNPVNTRWSVAEIAYSLDDCDTRILLVDDHFAHHVEDLRQCSTSLHTVVYAGEGPTPPGMVGYEELIAGSNPIDDVRRSGDDLAAVMYTGGTTGFPKGVMLSHQNLGSNAMAMLAGVLGPEPGRLLVISPMFHIAIGVMVHAQTMVGSTFVVVPSFAATAALEAIQTHLPTHMFLVPTMVQMLVDHPSAADFKLDSVRFFGYGGSVISAALLERAMGLFPNARFFQAYGMTELSPVATFLDGEDHQAGCTTHPELLRAAGRANISSEVRVVDDDGNEVPRGTVGEVVVRGPGVMLGYWNKPELTTAAIRDGWMHTGDGGRMDDDGVLYIVDRLKDMIVSGGENVFSAEVENALAKHPAVATSAVIGIPSEQWGESVHAVVVLKPGATASAEDLISHCQALIARYKCPRSVEFRDALPTTGAGKVLKSELRKPFWEGHDRAVN